MSLEFDVWPTAAVEKHVALARAAAGGGRFLTAGDVQAIEQSVRKDFPTWGPTDVIAFVEHVLHAADLTFVLTLPDPADAVARRRGTDIVTTWSPVEEATHYQVQHREGVIHSGWARYGFLWRELRTTIEPVDIGVNIPSDRWRQMRIRAVNGGGVSGWIVTDAVIGPPQAHHER